MGHLSPGRLRRRGRSAGRGGAAPGCDARRRRGNGGARVFSHASGGAPRDADNRERGSLCAAAFATSPQPATALAAAAHAARVAAARAAAALSPSTLAASAVATSAFAAAAFATSTAATTVSAATVAAAVAAATLPTTAEPTAPGQPVAQRAAAAAAVRPTATVVHERPVPARRAAR